MNTHNSKLLVILTSLIFCWSSLRADELQFSTELLHQTIETLKLSQLDTLPEGISLIPYRDQYQLRVERKAGRITHVGRQMFSDLFYTSTRPPVCDYLEFAWLDHTFNISDNPFIYQDLKFEEGDWNMVNEVTPETPCSIDTEQGAYFEVVWTLPEQRRVKVHLPIRYDRIQLMTRRELEQEFIHELKNYISPAATTNEVNASMLKRTEDTNIFVLQGDSYILPAINHNTYYHTSDNGLLELICDEQHPAETMANIVNGQSSSLPPCSLNLVFKLYAYQTETLRISLDDLLSYCVSKGCRSYWAIESIEGDRVSGTIYISNPTLGYNHVLHLTTDFSRIIQYEGKAEAEINLFIPTNNIINIFHQTKPHDENIICDFPL